MLQVNLKGYFYSLIVPVFIAAMISPFLITNYTTFTVSLIIFHILICVVGANMYHRYWTHKQFEMSIIAQHIICFFGLFSMLGSPLSYAYLHRWHHRFSDMPQDLHTPIDGRLHAFIGWYFKPLPEIPILSIRDLLRPQFSYLNFYTKYQLHIVYTTLCIIGLINFNILAALLVSMCISYVLIMLVNSHAHCPIEKRALDVKFLAWFNLGSYHYQHHLYPSDVKKGDPGYYLTKLLSKL
jgi:stearoyl-CoA desaturase (delta-9 desaturase)